ncbi:multiple sugar transport system ATP-binding protein [Devosia enhydra]|uniref:Multiple sugar transport system ATP-binding protein n=1 Tax=Devosia enhydra TaxID=665118 RepID=A0A1K2HZJ0_9HYPH|nr:sn-glycerol-3-phosphate ABC transporter ATP-binding protein UgpC [Devosia enhydra]SFZ84595.1 multiple sugar transport system ATP-binding protein [Devosia enhydra]
MTRLSISGLRKSFGVVDVLKSVDIEVEDNGFLVLLGPSGCGKSTLLNVIAGLERATAGSIRIDDRDITDVEAKDRDIAMVFQSYALYPSMSVARNITFSMEVRGVPRAERRKAAETVAASLQIEHLLDRRPAQLSGGQRQRVAIGRALVRSPKIFLFDEPLSNLDTQLRLETRALIKRLHQRVGATSVYVTHDQSEAMTLATRIAVMAKGEVAQFGTPAEIYARPASVFVARFVGSPPMNFLAGTIVGEGAGRTLQLDGFADIAPVALEATGLPVSPGHAVTVGIRPDRIVIGEGASRDGLRLLATIDLVEETGTDVLVYLKVGGLELIARQPPEARLTPGTSVPILLPVKDLHLFDRETELRIGF